MSIGALEFAYRALDRLGFDLKAAFVDTERWSSRSDRCHPIPLILGTAAVHPEWVASSSISLRNMTIPTTRIFLHYLRVYPWFNAPGIEKRIARIVASTPTSIRHTGVAHMRPDELGSVIDILADDVRLVDGAHGLPRPNWASLVLSLAQPYDEWPLEFQQESLRKLGPCTEMYNQAAAYKDRVAVYVRDGRALLANLAFEGIADLAALVLAFVAPRFPD